MDLATSSLEEGCLIRLGWAGAGASLAWAAGNLAFPLVFIGCALVSLGAALVLVALVTSLGVAFLGEAFLTFVFVFSGVFFALIR